MKPPTKKGVLDDLIKRELGIQEARKMGLDRDPEVIDRINTVLYHALLEKKLSKEFESIHISDEQARDYYSRNPEVRTSHIFVSVRPDSKPDEQAKALERIKKIQSEYLINGKMGFAEVAQRYSEGPAAAMGGDMDYQTRDRLDPVYYEAAVKLGSTGKTSGIVKTQFGYHIIKLTGIRRWEEIDKAQVKRLVFEEQRSKIFEKYMEGLKAHAKISSHSEMLKD
jgi:peptidyl-prolyl cis-trans isomerase C/peptidyl-prolyl cis-trans isomerase D